MSRVWDQVSMARICRLHSLLPNRSFCSLEKAIWCYGRKFALLTKMPQPQRFPLIAAHAILVSTVFFTASLAREVILLSTGDPNYNTTEPSGALTGSGWQYEGSFGSF